MRRALIIGLTLRASFRRSATSTLTGRLVVVERLCVPGPYPILWLRDKGPTEDQWLRHVAFYPTAACMIKMLYEAGFPSAHAFRQPPLHPDYDNGVLRRSVRTILAAAQVPPQSELLQLVPELSSFVDPWATPLARTRQTVAGLGRFLEKPWPEKAATLRRYLRLETGSSAAGDGKR